MKIISMKTLFTLLIVAPFVGFSQNFSFVAGNLVEKEIGLEEFENGESKILNSSDESVVFEWEMIVFDNPEGWDFSICDYTVCYTMGETEGTMTAVDGGSETAFMRVNTYANAPGVGTYTFVVWDQAIPEETDTITFVITALDASGIEEALTADKIGVTYSNANQIKLFNNSGMEANYSLLNISGQVIGQGVAGSHQNSTLPVNNLTKGIYFISFTEKGKTIKTQKIVIR